MNKITEAERQQLKQIITDAGLHIISSADEYNVFLNNSMEGYSKSPLFAYLCGGTFDADLVRNILLASYRATSENSISYSDSEALNSCAIWIPSGVNNSILSDFFKTIGPSLMKIGGLPLVMRVIRYESAVGSMKSQLTNHNDWYLYNYECNNESDNDEIYRKMIKPVVEYAWSAGRACYLESVIESRIAVLMKMGFHIVDTLDVPNGDFKIFGMMV